MNGMIAPEQRAALQQLRKRKTMALQPEPNSDSKLLRKRTDGQAMVDKIGASISHKVIYYNTELKQQPKVDFEKLEYPRANDFNSTV